MSICAKKEWCQICMEDHIEGDHKLKTNNLMKNKELLSWQDITPNIIRGLDEKIKHTFRELPDGGIFQDYSKHSNSYDEILLPAPLTSLIGEDVTGEEIEREAMALYPIKMYSAFSKNELKDKNKVRRSDFIKGCKLMRDKLALSSNKVIEREEKAKCKHESYRSGHSPFQPNICNDCGIDL